MLRTLLLEIPSLWVFDFGGLLFDYHLFFLFQFVVHYVGYCLNCILGVSLLVDLFLAFVASIHRPFDRRLVRDGRQG